MRGRHPAGPEYVERLDGSALAKHRLKTIMETMTRDLSVPEACTHLDICEQRFYQLREEALTAALASLEPGKPGRPAHTLSPAEQQVHDLEEQLVAKDLELRTAQAREEIAITLPRVVQQPDSQKKTTQRPRHRARGRPPGKKTPS